MHHGARQALAALALGAVVAACPDKSADAPASSDRTIEKLKAEQARIAREGPGPGAPPKSAPEALTQALEASGEPRELTLPSSAPVTSGAVSVVPKALSATQNVRGAKLTLTTVDEFVKVTLWMTAAQPVALDVTGAQLHSGERHFPLATDAMRLAGGSPLAFNLGPGPDQPLVLFFEVPRDALVKGLTLTLPLPAGSAEVALQ